MKTAPTALVLSALAQQAHSEGIEIGTVKPKIAKFPGLPSSLQDLIDKGNPTALSVTIPVGRFNTTLGIGYNFLKGEMLIEPCVLQNQG